MAWLSSGLGCSGAPGDGESVGASEEALTKVCQSGEVVPGIDVSKWQGTVDWPKVKASGVVFAFARTNDGSYIDPDFAANWKGMKAAGVIRGAYQFFRNTRGGAEQAEIMLNMTGPLDDGDLPPVLDVEGASIDGSVSTSATQKIIVEWVAHVKERTGRLPIVYTGSYFWRDTIKALDVSPVPLWIAHYTTKYCPLIPEPWTGWTFHQWGVTEVGSVPGIDAKVDRDVFNGNRAQFDRFIALSHLDGHLDEAPRPAFEAAPAVAPVTTVDETSPDAPDGGCALGPSTPKSKSYGWLLLGLAAIAKMRRRVPVHSSDASGVKPTP
jgi:lysozyme